jgi:hypothetical protein
MISGLGEISTGCRVSNAYLEAICRIWALLHIAVSDSTWFRNLRMMIPGIGEALNYCRWYYNLCQATGTSSENIRCNLSL